MAAKRTQGSFGLAFISVGTALYTENQGANHRQANLLTLSNANKDVSRDSTTPQPQSFPPNKASPKHSAFQLGCYNSSSQKIPPQCFAWGYTHETSNKISKTMARTSQLEREGASVSGPNFVKVSEAAAELPLAFKKVSSADTSPAIPPPAAVVVRLRRGCGIHMSHSIRLTATSTAKVQVSDMAGLLSTMEFTILPTGATITGYFVTPGALPVNVTWMYTPQRFSDNQGPSSSAPGTVRITTEGQFLPALRTSFYDRTELPVRLGIHGHLVFDTSPRSRTVTAFYSGETSESASATEVTQRHSATTSLVRTSTSNIDRDVDDHWNNTAECVEHEKPIMDSNLNKEIHPQIMHPAMQGFSFPSPPRDDPRSSTSDEQQASLHTSLHRGGASLGQTIDFDPILWNLESEELAAYAAQQQLTASQDPEEEMQLVLEQLATSQAVAQALRADLEESETLVANMRDEMAAMQRERMEVEDDHHKLRTIIQELQQGQGQVRQEIASIYAQHKGQVDALTQTYEEIIQLRSNDYTRVCEHLALLRNTDHVKLSGDLAQQLHDQKILLDNANARAAYFEAALHEDTGDWRGDTAAFERKAAEDAQTIQGLLHQFEQQLALAVSNQETAEAQRMENQTLLQEVQILRDNLKNAEDTLEGIARNITIEHLKLPLHRRNMVMQPKQVRTNRVRSLRTALQLSQKQHEDAEKRNSTTYRQWIQANKKVEDLKSQVHHLKCANAEVTELFNIAKEKMLQFIQAVPTYVNMLIGEGHIEGVVYDVLEATRHEELTIEALEKSAREVSRLRGQMLGLEHDHQAQIARIHRRVSQLELDNRRLDAEHYQAISQATGIQERAKQLESQKFELEDYVNQLQSQALGGRAESVRQTYVNNMEQLRRERSALLWKLANANSITEDMRQDRDLCQDLVSNEFFVIRDLAAQRDYLFNVVTALRERFGAQLRQAPENTKSMLPDFAIRTREQQREVVDDEIRIIHALDRATAGQEGHFPIRFGEMWAGISRLTGVVREEWGWKVDDDGSEDEWDNNEAETNAGDNSSDLSGESSNGAQQGSVASEDDDAGWEDASSDEDSDPEEDDFNHAWDWK